MRRRKLPPAAGDPVARRSRKLEEQEPPPVDRISALPDELLGEIITLLPIKDAGPTQILASRWRHLWRSTPLSLDRRDLTSNKGFHLTYLCPSLVLSAHPGPGRRLCLTTTYSTDTATTMDGWLRSAALDGLQELDFAGIRHMFAGLPASAFRFAPTLRVANFQDCALPEAAALLQSLHFPQLKQLGLERVRVSESLLHGLIAGCPALEFLLILSCSGFRRLRINSLTLTRIRVRIDEPGSAPQLQFGEIIVENAPRLQTLLHLYMFPGLNLGFSVFFSASKADDTCFDFLADLHAFRKRLESRYRDIRQGLPMTAEHTVKCLAVNINQFNLDEVAALLTLFPCLEKLHVLSKSASSEKNWWRRKHRNLIRCIDIRLKIVVLETYLGTLPHVNFATFFILNAKELELMTFHIKADVYTDKFLASQHRRLQLDNRASRGARFRFTTATCQHAVWGTKELRDYDLSDDPFTCRC